MDSLISIIIPIYKVERYLPACIESVIGQTYTNLEIILVDDESPDRCPQMCDDYARQDNRIKVIHKSNGGLSDARNCGIKMATGDYILFIDSDDYYISNTAIEELMDIVDKHEDADVVLFDYVEDYGNGQKILKPQHALDLSRINGHSKIEVLTYLSDYGNLFISACTKLIRRKLIIDHDIWFERGLFGEDIDWSLQFYIHTEHIYAIDNPIYAYRKRPNSITSSMKEKNFTDLLYIITKWNGLLRQTSLSEQEKTIYQGYMCYQYGILMGLICFSEPEIRKRIKSRMRPHADILKYDVNYKTHRICQLYKYLGFNATCWLLSQYIKFRRKGFNL